MRHQGEHKMAPFEENDRFDRLHLRVYPHPYASHLKGHHNTPAAINNPGGDSSGGGGV